MQLYTLYSIGNPLFTDEDVIDSNSYGVDTVDVDEDEAVSVPETMVPLSDASFSIVRTSIDPLQQSHSYAADIYLQAVNIVYRLMLAQNLVDD